MNARSIAEREAHRVAETRDRALDTPVHSTRTAAYLGMALGVTFTICFATGMYSHLIQHPPSWFHNPPRPAGLYRFTQGLHVATGTASIPLLLAKLWSVAPRLFQWPPVRSVAHVVERVSILPLVAGALYMLWSGFANTAKWYPWPFSFVPSHYAVAWITIGALVVHIGAKAGLTRDALRRAGDDEQPTTAPAGLLSRRGFIGAAWAGVGIITVATVGQTVRPLRRLSVLAPRRPDIGPQGLPINQSAVAAQVQDLAKSPDWRFTVMGKVPQERTFTLDELKKLPQHTARLPIACVEGWSATATWTGVSVRDMLAEVGADDGASAVVSSIQPGGAYTFSTLDNAQAHDKDTLLALKLNGDELHIDHGYPVRLIGPNRPGVLQTKWLGRLEVT